MEIALGLILPFVGTTLGAAMVFLLRDKLNNKVEKAIIGFASGVMIAASIWSLIIPSISQSQETYGNFSWVPATVGFMVGIIVLLILDTIIPHLHHNAKDPEGIHSHMSKNSMMFLAVTLHNVPEGMAVGVILAAAINGTTNITMTAALSLAIGIAIQNFPEGAIVSLPLKEEGQPKWKAFLFGTLSGAVEPAAAGLTILLTSFITSILPYLLSFAAGAMMYVVVEELIPDLQTGKHSNVGVLGFAIGFVIMMILDIALG